MPVSSMAVVMPATAFAGVAALQRLAPRTAPARSVGGRSVGGPTALHSAVVNNQPDSVRELLRLGIDTTIKTNEPADPDEDEPAMTALELAEALPARQPG